MGGRPPRRCIVAGCATLTTQARCPAHTLTYPHAERERMRAVVRQWILNHGYICPGYGTTPAHPADDLTADHITPRTSHGLGTALTVLCRECNARKGNHTR